MNEVFCDTLYFVALVDRNDQYHEEALKLTSELEHENLVTTDDIFIETLNFMSGYGALLRQKTISLLADFQARPDFVVIGRTQERFVGAWTLYSEGGDKGYSFTDCVSMVVMKERRIQKALTNDKHFRQEGFEILFADNGT